MKLGPNEFWAVVYDTHDGGVNVVSDGAGYPYLFGAKYRAEDAKRKSPGSNVPPVMRVARVRVEVCDERLLH